MKKILIIMILGSLSITSVASMIYNHQIPQPDFISNDWDGDGKPNSIDEDDDGDGILDVNDDTPFGRPDGNTEVSSGITSFTSNSSEIFIGETVSFSWNIEGNSNLSLFGGTFNQITGLDVTGLSAETDTPTTSTTYTLYSNSGASSVSVDVLPIPVVNSFTLNGSSSNISINEGDVVNIAWNIIGGQSISITGGDLGNQNNLSDSGILSDTPMESTSYSLFDGLNNSTLSVSVTNPCSFYAGNGSSPWTNWTTVIQSAQNDYQFYVGGNQLTQWISASSIPGYTIGAYMGTVGDLTDSIGLTKMYEICTTP